MRCRWSHIRTATVGLPVVAAAALATDVLAADRVLPQEVEGTEHYLGTGNGDAPHGWRLVLGRVPRAQTFDVDDYGPGNWRGSVPGHPVLWVTTWERGLEFGRDAGGTYWVARPFERDGSGAWTPSPTRSTIRRRYLSSFQKQRHAAGCELAWPLRCNRDWHQGATATDWLDSPALEGCGDKACGAMQGSTRVCFCTSATDRRSRWLVLVDGRQRGSSEAAPWAAAYPDRPDVQSRAPDEPVLLRADVDRDGSDDLIVAVRDGEVAGSLPIGAWHLHAFSGAELAGSGPLATGASLAVEDFGPDAIVRGPAGMLLLATDWKYCDPASAEWSCFIGTPYRLSNHAWVVDDSVPTRRRRYTFRFERERKACLSTTLRPFACPGQWLDGAVIGAP